MLVRRLGMLFLLVYTTLQTSVNSKNHLRPTSIPCCVLLFRCYCSTVFIVGLLFLCFTACYIVKRPWTLGQHCSRAIQIHIEIVIVIVYTSNIPDSWWIVY